jgi:cell division protein FtsB
MAREPRFFRDAGPVLLRMEQRSPWQVDAQQFRGLALALGAVAVCLLLVTWGRTCVLTNGYEIMGLRQDRDQLAAEHRRLQGRLEEMQSLAYAETEARQRLGMVGINPNQVINLKRRSAAGALMDDVAALFGRDPKPGAAPGKR